MIQAQLLQHGGTLCLQDVFSANAKSLLAATGLSDVRAYIVLLKMRELPVDRAWYARVVEHEIGVVLSSRCVAA